jgi:hypothetical protein
MQFDEGELRGPIDRDEEMELSFSGSNLGDVDTEISDRVVLARAYCSEIDLQPYRA